MPGRHIQKSIQNFLLVCATCADSEVKNATIKVSLMVSEKEVAFPFTIASIGIIFLRLVSVFVSDD